MRLTPIVVLVTSETQDALVRYVSMVADRVPEFAAHFDSADNSNGWTAEMVIGGTLLAQAIAVAEVHT